MVKAATALRHGTSVPSPVNGAAHDAVFLLHGDDCCARRPRSAIVSTPSAVPCQASLPARPCTLVAARGARNQVFRIRRGLVLCERRGARSSGAQAPRRLAAASPPDAGDLASHRADERV